VQLAYLVTDGQLQSSIATVTIRVVVPDNVPSSSNNNSSTTSTEPVTPAVTANPVAAPVTSGPPSDVEVGPVAPKPNPVSILANSVPKVVAAAMEGLDKEKNLLGGVVIASASSKFKGAPTPQYRYEHFHVEATREREEFSSPDYRWTEQRRSSEESSSEVQFNMDSALVRAVIGSGVVVMVMQGTQLAATLMAVNPTLAQFDITNIMSGGNRGDKRLPLGREERLFDK